MSRKTKQSYKHAFQYIKDNILDLTGESIMTDFELAMRKVIADVFPGVKLLTCWFHFTQAAKKWAMQTLQLIPNIRKYTEAAEIYYKLLSLPLLPPEHIMEQFQILKVLARANHRSIFADFLMYYGKQ